MNYRDKKNFRIIFGGGGFIWEKSYAGAIFFGDFAKIYIRLPIYIYLDKPLGDGIIIFATIAHQFF